MSRNAHIVLHTQYSIAPRQRVSENGVSMTPVLRKVMKTPFKQLAPLCNPGVNQAAIESQSGSRGTFTFIGVGFQR